MRQQFRFIMIAVSMLPCLSSSSALALAPPNTWNGSGPFATSLGNRTITALALSADGRTLYAGSGSGTLFKRLHAPPAATTNAASGITTVTAILNGTVDPLAVAPAGSDPFEPAATVTFEYGLDNNYGTTVTAAQSPLTVPGSTAVSKELTGLTPGVTYHFRVKGASIAGESNGADLSFSTVSIPILTVTVAGTGSGTVTSVPAGIACTAGSCAKTFSGTVNLYATPSALSLFGGWSGGVCSGTSMTCSVTMNGNKDVLATFSPAPLLQIDGTPYDTLQEAYDAATGGAVIQLLESTVTGSLNANRAITIKLKGGYNADYSATPGKTTVTAPLRIRQGRVTADRINVR